MQARSRLYARRVKGDLDLGLEPARIDGGGNRQWAEILTPGGLLPGGIEQGIFTPSVNPNYRIGTRRVVADCVYHYCFTYEAQVSGKGAFNGHQVGGHEMHAAGGAIVEHAAGLSVVALDCVDVIGADDLAGGYLVRYAAPAFRCRIASNLATDAGIIAITLVDPLPVIINATDWIVAYPSIYRRLSEWGTVAGVGAVGETATTMRAVVCVPPIDLVADRWFWGQTWGPCTCGAGNMANLIGKTANQRMVHFDGLGWAWYTAVAVVLAGMQPKANMEDFKNRMPQDLSAIPDCAVRAAAHTVQDGLGFLEGVGRGVTETLDGVKNQIKRVTG